MAKSTQTHDWLTFESAAEIEGHSIDTLTESLQQDSPERALRVRGFLFDRARHEAGQPCLQLLEPLSEETEPDDSDATEPDDSEAEADDLNPKPVSDQPSDRTYNWDTLPLTVQIRWQEGTPRQVLISATTYDDFPLAALVEETALGDLPESVQSLLHQLQQDLSIRAVRYRQAQGKAKPKSPPKQPTKQPTPPAQTSTSSPPPKSTQISLF